MKPDLSSLGKRLFNQFHRLILTDYSTESQVEGLMMCESKMISKNNDEVDVGCGNAFGGEGAEEVG